MATGHWNPGYGNIVTRARRSRSARPGLPTAGSRGEWPAHGPLEDGSLERIRQQARQAWLKASTTETSYQDHCQDKTNQMDGYTQTRPTSAHRRNKPHPPLVFLTCRLHSVPGYHDPDATLGKNPYKVDAMLPQEHQIARAGLRRKFIPGRPSTAAIMQYAEREGGREFAPEAAGVDMPDIWRPQLTTPNGAKGDRERMRAVLNHLDEDQAYEYEAPFVASHHRYLRPAGFEEMAHLMEGGRTVGGIRSQDIERMHSVRTPNHAERTRRGDYLIHPEWPPSFPHHRLNGLSSVPIPYSHDRR